MSKVFVDANFIVSVFREIEDNHDKACHNLKILLSEHECYISNGIILEIITIIMMRTKDLELTKIVYYFLKDNFTIVNEYEIEKYNDRVFSIFKKYNKNTFKLSFIDCSTVVISKFFDLKYVVSFDKKFKLFNEIKVYELEDVEK